MRLLDCGLLAGLVLALPLTAQKPSAAAWPHWYGPARDGISWQTQWSSVGSSEPLWRAEVGRGYSNVVIQDGRLFTLGFDEGAGMDRLFCLDAETGEELWRKEWPAEIRANFHGGGTLTTPTIDGDVVFASNREGRCMALRAESGELLWERNYTDELGLEITFHGFSASPLALADRLVLVLGGTVAAVDKASGDVLWRTKNHGDGGYSNPVPFELAGRTRLCVFLGIGPVVLDAETGEELHRYPWKPKAGGVNVSTPIVFDGKIFISSAYNQGGALLEIGDDPELKQLWRTRRMRNKVSGCFLWQRHIYGFDESMLKCIDLQGEEKWRVRGLGMGSVAVASGRLLVLTSKGELIVAAATPEEFRELSRRKVLDDGVYWTTPIQLDGRIYCRNSLGSLVCLDHRITADSSEIGVGPAQPVVGDLPSAERLFAAHARAIGGEELRARRSLRLEGTIEVLGAGITRTAMTMDRTAPDKWRLTYDLGPFGTFRTGFDGEIGWVLDPFEGNRLLEGDELREVRQMQRLHALLEWQTAYRRVETVGRRTFADRDCWVVAASAAEGVARRFYFDAADGHLVGRDGEGESMVIHTEWGVFDGVKLPTKTTIVAPETGAEQTLVVESATWDGVDAEVYARPEAVKKLLRSPEQVEAANRAARREFARYLGAYRGNLPDGPARWVIAVTSGDLVVEMGDGNQMPLRKTDAEHRFVLQQTDSFWVEFRVDESGAARGFVFGSEERTFEFERDT